MRRDALHRSCAYNWGNRLNHVLFKVKFFSIKKLYIQISQMVQWKPILFYRKFRGRCIYGKINFRWWLLLNLQEKSKKKSFLRKYWYSFGGPIRSPAYIINCSFCAPWCWILTMECPFCKIRKSRKKFLYNPFHFYRCLHDFIRAGSIWSLQWLKLVSNLKLIH